MIDEQQRIEHILSGDMKAFKSFVEDYERLVSHIVYRMVSNATDREEICQEVFIKIYRNLKTFAFQSKLSTWVGRIAYNTSLNYIDKKKVALYGDLTTTNSGGNNGHLPQAAQMIEMVATQAPQPDGELIQKETRDFLKKAIDRLPPQYRTVLSMYHQSELSYAEISSIMNMPEGTVKSHLFRARKLLKEILLDVIPADQLQYE